MATAKDTGKTEVTAKIFCDPCKDGDEHKVAVSYCEYCNEYLCEICNTVHKRLKATKSHSVKQEDELPLKRFSEQIEADLFEKCTAHENFVLDQYCVSHNELCCSQCLSTIHKTCINVQNIADHLNTFDFQHGENILETKMRQLADELSRTMNRINVSLKTVEYYHSKAQSEMLKAKHSAIDHIESLYRDLSEESNKMREADLERIMSYKHKCDEIAFGLKIFNRHVSNQKKSSRKNLFFAMKNIEAKMSSDFNALSDIKSIEHFNVTRYRFKASDEIDDIKSKLSSLGSMELEPDVMKSATKIKSLKVKEDNDEDDCCITGITLLLQTCLVLVDNRNMNIKVVDTEEDKIISNLKFESVPWDVTCISNNKVAVTFPEKNTIELLSINSNAIFDRTSESQIACSGKCYGITSFKETIIVTVRQNEETTKVERYGLDGSLLLSVVVDVKNPQYVVCNEDETKIYVSDNTRYFRIVELSSNDFATLGKLTSCRDEVTGMAIDKTGVMYYCDSYYHQIDMVYLYKKKIGERERLQLISDRSPSPMCLVFCYETTRLFVGLDGNEISVYEVF